MWAISLIIIHKYFDGHVVNSSPILRMGRITKIQVRFSASLAIRNEVANYLHSIPFCFSAPTQPDRQMTPTKNPFARGNNSKARTTADPGQTIIATQSGQLFDPNAKMNGARIWPTSKIVSHAGPSSARICPNGSPHTAQFITGFK